MAYPWSGMPLRKCVDVHFDQFPTALKNVLQQLMAMEYSPHKGYAYVARENKGVGWQVQWYCRTSRSVKRLAKVDDPAVGGLVRAAALFDPRILGDTAVHRRFYESGMRWLDWIAAVDVQDVAARALCAEARAAKWIDECAILTAFV